MPFKDQPINVQLKRMMRKMYYKMIKCEFITFNPTIDTKYKYLGNCTTIGYIFIFYHPAKFLQQLF